MHQYSRSERLLTRPFPDNPIEHGSTQPAMNGHGFVGVGPIIGGLGERDKGKSREPGAGAPAAPRKKFALLDLALPDIDESAQMKSRMPMGLGAPDFAAEQTEGTTLLVDSSVACRYLAAQCQVRQGKWAEAAEMLGDANPFRGTIGSGSSIANTDGGIKVSSNPKP